MNIKRVTAFLIVYVLIIISVPSFFNNAWLKLLPGVETYNGSLEFSGVRAYKDLEVLVKDYPNRVVGSENARSSALWVKSRFSEMGLKTKEEEFQCLLFRESRKGSSLGGVFEKVKGINVIGTSTGKSDEVIVIGAHRDIIGSVVGAQDNATGTAAMLELARVLTSKEHYYTYMFVSYDGEEIGLKGAEHFVKSNPHLKIKLSMVLDCVGYKDADTIGLYQFAGSKGASPLWTVALAENLMSIRGMPMYYLDDEGGFAPLGINLFNPLFNKFISQRIAGDVNTDTGPFVAKNIPSVGFIAAKQDRKVDHEGVFHTHSDVVSYVSADTMDMIGKFAEQYIMSINLNKFEGVLGSNQYLVMGDKYLGNTEIVWFGAFIVLMVLMLWLISSIDIFKNHKFYIGFIRRELKWIFLVMLLSAASGFYWLILKLDMFFNTSLLIIFLVWFLFSAAGIVSLLTLRFLSVGPLRGQYFEITGGQRMLLNTIYTLVFFGMALYYNIFVAMAMMAFPLLLMARVGYKDTGVRITWGIIFIVWSIIQTGIFFICLQPYVFGIITFKTSVLLFINTFLWGITFIYTISTPGMPKKNSNAVQRSDKIGNYNWSHKH
ncbi:MAG: M28 family peptidase [Bacillota bacterium]